MIDCPSSCCARTGKGCTILRIGFRVVVKALFALDSVVSPDTLIRWHRRDVIALD
jgi:hypothetical protein